MKFYIVTYNTAERGELEAFTSKREAQRRHAELSKVAGQMEEREFGESYADIEQVYSVGEVDFPATKEGIRRAIEFGGANVPK